MGKHWIFLSVLASLFAACAAPTPPPNQVPAQTISTASPDVAASFLGIAWDNPGLFSPGLTTTHKTYAAISGATIYHAALEISPNLRTITGRVEILYTNRETQSLDEIQLRLFPNLLGSKLRIDKPTANGQTVPVKYGLRTSLARFMLATPLQPGETVELGMDIHLNVSENPTENYGVLASQEGILTLAHALPMVCVFDDEGWNAEIPPQDGDLTYNDASFYLVKVNAPAQAQLIATGQMLEHTQQGETQTALFALGPARDFMLVSASGYEKYSKQLGEVTINSYAPPEYQEYAELALDTAREALSIFSTRYTPYPYTEFDVVATPTLALGVEYPGLVAITNRLYDPSGQDNRIYLEGTVAHETGHQWYYNLVGNDQLDEPWLDESLTQFITWQYYSDRYGQSGAYGFQESLEARWDRVEQANIPIGQPVAAYHDKEYSAIVYGRGALFFIALRDKIGDAAFDQFLHEYTRELTWQVATSTIIKERAETTCNCDLSPLFAEWIDP